MSIKYFSQNFARMKSLKRTTLDTKTVKNQRHSSRKNRVFTSTSIYSLFRSIVNNYLVNNLQKKLSLYCKCTLTHLFPMHLFSILMFSVGREKMHWEKMDLRTVSLPSKSFHVPNNYNPEQNI